MKFSQDFINQVLLASDILEVISKHTDVQSHSRNLMALCPYPDHSEKTPSFSISQEKQVYHCFGCQKSGNIFTFLKDIRGMNFVESLDYLAQRAGLALPSPSGSEKPRKTSEGSVSGLNLFERKRELLKIYRLATVFFHRTLLSSPPHSLLRNYLKKRRLHEETLQLFQIGWAPQGGQSLLSFLKNQGVSLILAEQSGLIKRNEKTRGLYDYFRGRLIFPIFSFQGQCVAFGGRTLEEEVLPKYLNSPESEIFHKKEVLYGLHESSRFLKQKNQVIVVEGYMDFLSLYQKGFRNVVATLGTALSSYHVRRLKNFTSHVLIFFDGDVAGKKAARRALPLFLSEGLCPRVLQLPEKEDPDTFVNTKSLKQFQLEERRAPELFSVVLEEELKQGVQSASEKWRVIEKLAPILTGTLHSRLKSLYVKEFAAALNVEEKWLFQTLASWASKKVGLFSATQSFHSLSSSSSSSSSSTSDSMGEEAKREQKEGENHESSQGKNIQIFEALVPAEKNLLHLALSDEKRFLRIREEKVTSYFSNQNLIRLFSLAEKIYRQNPKNFAKIGSLLMLQVEPEEVLVPSFFIQNIEPEQADKLMMDCLLRVREFQIQRKCQDLSERLEFASSKEESQLLLKKFMNARRERENLQERFRCNSEE